MDSGVCRNGARQTVNRFQTMMRNLMFMCKWTLIIVGVHLFVGCGKNTEGECINIDAPAKVFIHDSRSLIESVRLFYSPYIDPAWQEKLESIQPDVVFIFAETIQCSTDAYNYLLDVKMKSGTSFVLAGPPRTAVLDRSLQSAFGRTADLYGISYFEDYYKNNPSSTLHYFSNSVSDFVQVRNIGYKAIKIDFTGNNKEDIQISICPSLQAYSIDGC